MGSGNWTSMAYTSKMAERGIKTTLNSATMSAVADLSGISTSQYYTQRTISDRLNPYQVMRECVDSSEHPNTIPVLLALDVTGSMGQTANACAAKLNEIMELLYRQITDDEFMVCALGDLSYDSAPFQAGQFESDIRISDQLDLVYFEAGGGGNRFESYTLPWYFGLHNTSLDCWKRNKKGIIITMGDEPLNPYLPHQELNACLGCHEQADIDTKELYQAAREKFDIYHLSIDERGNSYHYHKDDINQTWPQLLGENYRVTTLDNLSQIISNIIINAKTDMNTVVSSADGISW